MCGGDRKRDVVVTPLIQQRVSVYHLTLHETTQTHTVTLTRVLNTLIQSVKANMHLCISSLLIIPQLFHFTLITVLCVIFGNAEMCSA